jgi:hypothetical protein
MVRRLLGLLLALAAATAAAGGEEEKRGPDRGEDDLL